MSPVSRRIVAIVSGFVLGSIVNMLILDWGTSYLIPPPPGTDMSSPEGLAASMKLFQPEHFVFPFLAHALGTLFGCVTAALIFRNDPLRAAMPVGIIFLLGGAYMVYQLPSPLWFNITDLALAYIPMVYSGVFIANRIRKTKDK